MNIIQVIDLYFSIWSTFRNEVTNIGYPTNGPVAINAGIRECSLEITNVSRREEHFGRWTCLLSKTNLRGRDLWKEVTNYDVHFFTPAKMEISIQTRDRHESANKYGTSVMTYHFMNYFH